MSEPSILRLCEWGSCRVEDSAWPRARRVEIERAAQSWRATHRLNALPLAWSGSDGCILQARQWVGVVEVAGARIEIYPKTDKAFLERATLHAEEAQSTLQTLLRILEAAHFKTWLPVESAALQVGELSFVDVWAWLYAWHLRDELRRGPVRDYLAQRDDLFAVRGRIDLARQLTRFGDRLDRVACEWDEFSPDTPLLRLLKCACRSLQRRTRAPATNGLLSDCLLMLDEVADIDAANALRAVERLVWTRGRERFRSHFNLAQWILRELGPQSARGAAQSWTFLVDMNAVFEDFVQAALQDRYNVMVEAQKPLGHLIRAPFKRQIQIADYIWQYDGRVWIGDAKWKPLQSFAALDDEDSPENTKSRLKLQPADIRQLTTYAELWQLEHGAPVDELAIFFPDLGTKNSSAVAQFETWNGARLHLVPVRLQNWQRVGDALPPFAASTCSEF